MKKVLLLTLFVCQTVVMFAADNWTKVDNLWYWYNDAKTVAAVVAARNSETYTGLTGTITIPATIPVEETNIPVTEIRAGVFQNCANISSVVIQAAITEIFSNCFKGCTQLSTINIPAGVTKINSSAFQNCSSLDVVNIPDGVISIEGSAFSGCSGMTEVNIPASVTSIGGNAFTGCTSLTKVNFASYESLCNINFNQANSNPLNNSGAALWINGVQQTNLIIPSDVTTIKQYAFARLNSVSSIDFSAVDGGLTIGTDAFVNNSGYNKVIFKNAQQLCSMNYSNLQSNPLYYGHHIYYANNANEIKIVAIPSTCLDGEDKVLPYIFAGATDMTRVDFPQEAQATRTGSFTGCTSIEFVGFETQKSFDDISWGDNSANPFFSTTKEAKPLVNGAPLESLTLNANVTSGKYLNAKWLKEVTFETDVTEIGSQAFKGCINLTTVTIKGSITTIGNQAFHGCQKLSNITLPESLTTIGEEAFRNCEKFTTITIPSSCTLGNGAFVWCTQLKTVTINSYIDIPELCFQNCGNLEKVITTSTKSIGDRAFENCVNLTEVPVTDGLEAIGNNAFYGCTKLTNLLLSERGALATIGESAFKNCTSVTMVSLPASIGTINDNAFYGCTALADVYCLKETTPVPIIYGNSFGGRESEIKLHVTNTTDYASTENWNKFNIVARKDVTLTFYVNDEQEISITHEAGTRITEDEPTVDLVDNGTTKEEFSGWDKPFPETMPSDDTNFYGYVTTTTTIENYKYKLSPAESLNEKNLEKRAILIGVVDNTITQSNSKVTVPLTVTNTNGNFNKDEFPVIAIGANAFKGQGELAKITLTTNIEELGESAFLNCGKLERVEGLTDSKVTVFSDYLFQNCTSLSFDRIPNQITSIGKWALSNTYCSTVTIPSTITTMGEEAFKDCKSLEKVTFADGFGLALPQMTFLNCGALKDVTLVGTMGSIGIRAFEGCGSISNLVIPEGIESIGKLAFNGCNKLANVTLPSSITIINEQAFMGCNSLAQLVVEATNVPTTYSNVFESETYQNAYVYVADYDKYSTKDPWKDFVHLTPNTTKQLTYKVDGEQYGEIDNLKVGQTIVPREKPTKEGHDFQGWEGLYDMMPANDIEVTGKFQYQLTYELAEGTLEDNPKSLYYGDKIVIPVDVLKKDSKKFTVTFKMTENPEEDVIIKQDVAAEANISMPAKDLTAVVSYELSEKEVTVGSLNYKVYLLENERRAEVMVSPDASGNVEIPATINVNISEDPEAPNLQDINVTAIQDNAFDGKQTITGMTLPEGILSIGKRAFYDNRFTTFTVPASVTTIGSEAFRCCRTMQTLTFADNSPITELPFGVYQDCSALKNVILPDQLQRIEENGFNNCTQLEKVTLPATLTFLGARAFAGCTALTQITTNPTTAPTTANSSNLFSNEIYTTATLYVKDGSNGYNQAPWSSFTHTGVLKEYTLTYQWDNEEAQTKQVMVGDKIDLPTPSGEKYEGREFSGWQELPEVMPAENVEVTGKFQYQLTYELAEGTLEDNPKSLYYGDKIVIPVDVLKKDSKKFTVTFKMTENPEEDVKVTQDEATEANVLMPAKDLTAIVSYELSEKEVTVGSLNYKVYLLENERRAEVMVSPDASGNVEIPATINVNISEDPEAPDLQDINVTAIQDNAFDGKQTITGMALPEGILSIGKRAFYDNRFTTFTVPASVTTIGSEAFRCCRTMQTLTFADNSPITELPFGVYQDCSALKNVVLPDQLQRIEENGFNNCTQLESVTLPTAVTFLGVRAFVGCTALTQITTNPTTAPETASSSNVFSDAIYTTATLYVKDGSNGYDQAPWSSFTHTGVLKEYTLTYQWDDQEAQTKQVMVGDRIDLPTPSGEKYEGREFSGWQGLPEVMPAEDVEVTGKFKYELSYEMSGESAEESKAFKLPDDAWYWYGDPIQLSNELNHENYSFTTTGMPEDNKMPSNDVKIIVKYSRSEETTIVNNINYKVVLLEVDGEPAHAEVLNSPSATGNVEIPDNITYNENTYPVTVIQDNAFNSGNSRQVTGMTLSSNLKRIGALAFRDCRFVTLTIPAKVESIGNEAFLYCTTLQNVTFEANSHLTELANGAFQSCSSLESIQLPEGLETIGVSAFAACNALTSVEFPSTLNTIGDYAFSGDAEIATVTVSTNLPTGKSTIFDDKVYDNAMLSVPQGTTITTLPWTLFQNHQDGGETTKCATPTIKYDKGTLKFECATDGATIVSEVKDVDITKSTSANKELTKKYTITAYAKKSGMLWSDEVTATIIWRNGKPLFSENITVVNHDDPVFKVGDVDENGEVNLSDARKVVRIFVGKE